MKTWAEFAMHGRGAQSLLRGFPKSGPGWHVDEEESSRITKSLRREHFSVRAVGETYPEVFIGITADTSDAELYTVTNVVPTVNGQLTKDQYNQAILDFYDRHVREHEGPDLVVSPPRGEEDLSEYMGAEGIELLRKFSDLANKGTGTGHPLDAQRWRSFVIWCHLNEVDLPSHILRGALEEEFGWHEEGADELVGKFETARELLEQYDEERE